VPVILSADGLLQQIGATANLYTALEEVARGQTLNEYQQAQTILLAASRVLEATQNVSTVSVGGIIAGASGATVDLAGLDLISLTQTVQQGLQDTVIQLSYDAGTFCEFFQPGGVPTQIVEHCRAGAQIGHDVGPLLQSVASVVSEVRQVAQSFVSLPPSAPPAAGFDYTEPMAYMHALEDVVNNIIEPTCEKMATATTIIGQEVCGALSAFGECGANFDVNDDRYACTKPLIEPILPGLVTLNSVLREAFDLTKAKALPWYFALREILARIVGYWPWRRETQDVWLAEQASPTEGLKTFNAYLLWHDAQDAMSRSSSSFVEMFDGLVATVKNTESELKRFLASIIIFAIGVFWTLQLWDALSMEAVKRAVLIEETQAFKERFADTSAATTADSRTARTTTNENNIEPILKERFAETSATDTSVTTSASSRTVTWLSEKDIEIVTTPYDKDTVLELMVGP